MENIIMVVAILNIIPTVLMVPRVAAATPKNRGSTELMTALVLGDENRAYPKPAKSRTLTM
jgi:hypothetical protein